MCIALTAAGCADLPDTEEVDEAEPAELQLAPTYSAQVKRRTLSINGNNADARLTLRLGDTTTIIEVDVGDDGLADFRFDRTTFERIVVDAAGGNDHVTIDEQRGAFTLEEQVTINGGGGDDTIVGGIGPETIVAGSGHDTVRGHRGADTIALGAGDDTYTWEPGDASDVLEGDDGLDRLVFNLSSASEEIALRPNGERLRLTRDIATVAMDLHAVERIDLNTRSGADRVVIDDLTGTEVAQINVELTSTVPGQGDLQADLVIVNGTTAADTVDVERRDLAVVATAGGTEVSVTGGELALDRLIVNGDAADLVNIDGSPDADAMWVVADAAGALYDGGGFNVLVAPSPAAAVTVNGLDGDDTIATSGGVVQPLVLDGGAGDDQLQGGYGADLLRGGLGHDVVDGNGGADRILLGEGDDTYVWDPGDGSDVIEGEAGADALRFTTANVGETIELRPDGSRVRLTRNVALVDLDLDGIERLDVRTRGGADLVVVHPLAGTAATQVNVDLAAYDGATTGDGAADQVVVSGLTADTIEVTADGDAVSATGLGAAVRVRNGEPALDRMLVSGGALNVNGSPAADTMVVFADPSGPLYDGGGFNVLVAPSGVAQVTVRGHGGDDVISTSGGVTTPLTLDGGDGSDRIQGGYGADLLLGGAGDDIIDGQPGADVVRLGDGNDRYVWDPGDGSDIVDGDGDTDTLSFHGAAIGETLELHPSGSRARLTRNIGSVIMDLGSLERVEVEARGGNDAVMVGDLTGTPVAHVRFELAYQDGSQTGDGVMDAVTLLGSPANDAIAITAATGAVVVTGLAATVELAHPEAFDRLDVHGLGGVDTFLPAPGLEALITLTTYQD